MPTKPIIWKSDLPFLTESGVELPELSLAYQTWGKLNDDKSNVVIVCHALTGNSDASDWFPGIFEEDGFIDFDRHFVICINVLGSCYGSTGPASRNPKTQKTYWSDFPIVTIRDAVQTQRLLLDDLGISSIECVIGASMGGMQALEWLILDKRVKRGILIASNMAHSAWNIGISEAQRAAIYTDPLWNDGFPDPNNLPRKGLGAARMMGMITYRSATSFENRFGRKKQLDSPLFQVESYLRYQGEKLADRMDAVTYVRLTQMMDSHDVSRDRGTFDDVLSQVHQPILVVGIDSDILYPTSDQKNLEALLPNANYVELSSENGHDSFLIDFDVMNRIFNTFLEETGFPLQRL